MIKFKVKVLGNNLYDDLSVNKTSMLASKEQFLRKRKKGSKLLK